MPFANRPIVDCDQADIIVGIAICAGQTYEWTLTAMLQGRWESIVSRWTKEIRGLWWKRQAVSWTDSEALFRAYLTDGYSRAPVNRYLGGGGVALTAPWEELLLCRLVEYGWSASEVLNMYLPAAWYHYFTVAEFRQLDNCTNPKNWRKTFYTRYESERLKGIKHE